MSEVNYEKQCLKLLSEMSPKQLKITEMIFDNPKRALEALEFTIRMEKDIEAKRQFMNVKHELEKYIMETEAESN